jgi:hypothetical protein
VSAVHRTTTRLALKGRELECLMFEKFFRRRVELERIAHPRARMRGLFATAKERDEVVSPFLRTDRTNELLFQMVIALVQPLATDERAAYYSSLGFDYFAMNLNPVLVE